MKKLLVIFLVLLAGGAASVAAQATDYGRQLEAVRSARSTADFMTRLSRDFGRVDFELDSLFLHMQANCATCQLHTDSLKEQD